MHNSLKIGVKIIVNNSIEHEKYICYMGRETYRHNLQLH